MSYHGNLMGSLRLGWKLCQPWQRNFIHEIPEGQARTPCRFCSAHRIHGTGIFTYMKTIKFSQMEVNIPYMDPMGYNYREGKYHKNDLI